MFECDDRNDELVLIESHQNPPNNHLIIDDDDDDQQPDTLGYRDGKCIVAAPALTTMQKVFKKLSVRVDPQTGKKLLYHDGKWLEVITPKKLDTNLVSKLQGLKGKIDRQTSTEDLRVFVDKSCQTEQAAVVDTIPMASSLSMLPTEVSTLSEFPYSGPIVDDNNATFSGDLVDFILNSSSDATGSSLSGDFCVQGTGPLAIDADALLPVDANKLNFFKDLREALQFNARGNLPIHENVLQNSVKDVKRNCIILRALRCTPNQLNHFNYSPLQLAVLHNASDDLVRVLLEFGADPLALNTEGNTVYHLAVEAERTGLLKVILQHANTLSLDVDVFNYDGYTPLILASCTRSYDTARLLLQYGAQVNLRDKRSGRTSLFHAAENYDFKLVELLVNNKADTRIRNFFGTSTHDAMYEIDDIPIRIKYLVLGKVAKRGAAQQQQSERASGSKSSSSADAETVTGTCKGKKLKLKIVRNKGDDN